LSKLQETLANHLLENHPRDAAEILEGMDTADSVAFVARMGADSAASILHEMSPLSAAQVLGDVPAEKAIEIIGILDLDFCAAMLRTMAPEIRDRVLLALPSGRSDALRSLVGFPEGTAGALMDPLSLALPRDMEVRDAIKRFQEMSRHAHFNIYVVDRDHVLVGALNIRELLTADPKKSLQDVMNTNVHSVPAPADRWSIIEHPGWRVTHSLPVVDHRGVYLGAIRYRMMRHLEEDLRGRDPGGGARTAHALGTLFWTGLGAVLEAMTSAFSADRASSSGGRKDASDS
jgi:magnesium transporter